MAIDSAATVTTPVVTAPPKTTEASVATKTPEVKVSVVADSPAQATLKPEEGNKLDKIA